MTESSCEPLLSKSLLKFKLTMASMQEKLDAKRKIISKKRGRGQYGELNLRFLTKAILDNTNRVIIAERDDLPGGIAAYDISKFSDDEGDVYICIIQAIQAVGGMGIGTDLMVQIEGDVVMRCMAGATGVILLNSISDAVGFYEKMEFEKIEAVDKDLEPLLKQAFPKLECGDCLMVKLVA